MHPIALIILSMVSALGVMLFALWYVTRAVEERRKGWVSSDDKESDR
jgi:hypothetical protein